VAVAQVSGVQPAPGTHTPDAQTRLVSQVPQSIDRPQPLPTLPQYLPLVVVQASGVQLESPTHSPWSQTSPAGQLAPQSIVPKQPLPITPQ
jgi:hypothetical protein